MRFKCGDLVIKVSGGNKMTIYDVDLDLKRYECIWFIDNNVNKAFFGESDLITLDEYKKVLKTEERDDKINQLLN